MCGHVLLAGVYRKNGEMDHSELVAELAKIEKLTAAERLKMARDRRAHQLRVFEQNERDYSKMNKSVNNQRMKNLRNKSRSVRFVHSVMLLEAAARNDIEEGFVNLVEFVTLSFFII